MGNPLTNALSFIIGAILSLFALLVAIRFVMQVVRADYHNPLSQIVMKLTDPVVIPLRRFVPSVQGYDTASILLAYGALFVKFLITKALGIPSTHAFGYQIGVAAMSVGKLLIVAAIDLLYLFFNVFIFAMIIRAILSWIPGAQGHAGEGLLRAITEPVIRPVRNIVPAINGLDLSVFLAIIGLIAVRILVCGLLVKVLLG